MVAALLSLVLGASITFWFTTTRRSSALQGRVEGIEHVHRGFRRLVRELRGARRILAPLPGERVDGRLVFVDGAGQVVRYRWVPEKPAGQAPWTRENWNQTVEILHPELRDFQCRVAPVPPGRDPGLVHLRVGFPGPDGKPVYMFTSVRSRALDVRCPIDR